MDEQFSRIVKYLLLIVLILNVISILVPWGTLDASIFGKADFYSWGSHIRTFNGENNYSLNVFFLDSSNFNDFFNISDFEIGFIPLIMGILVLFFSILVISFTIGFLVKNEFYKKDIISITVYSILAVICFYIFIQFGITSMPASAVLDFEYSSGLYLVILSICILVFTYFLFDFYTVETKTVTDKNIDSPALNTLKMRYAKGEITNEEFEQMKKDIE